MAADYLREALDLAWQGAGRVSPNPAVGAVLVRDGEVVGRGFHTWAGVQHAEIAALAQAGERGKNATLYINLEPCSHEGRTGPCVDALIHAGLSRVVAIMEDPDPRVRGRGFARLRQAGIDVVVDAGHLAEAEKLNEAFLHYMRTGRPLVTLKAAITLDGKIAAPEDNRGWITSDTARADVQRIRHLSDAIMTGIGTVLGDDCLLTDRTGLERSRPLMRVVLDSQLRLPVSSKMVASATGDVTVVTTSAASRDRRKVLEERGVRVVVADGPNGRTDLQALVDFLAKERYQSLMIEAGSKVNWAALEYGIVDKVFFYYAPKIFGGLESLPVVGGTGRRRKSDAILLHDLRVQAVATDEFAVEGWVVKEP